MIKVNAFILNGEEYYINSEDKITIYDLILYFNFNTSLLILEYNNLIYNKNEWKNIIIHNKDKIELITIVGGG